MQSTLDKYNSQGEIVIYQTDDGKASLDVMLENETVWLTQKQMALLFETTPQNITMHIGNIFKEGELTLEATCKEFLQVQIEGSNPTDYLKKMRKRDPELGEFLGTNCPQIQIKTGREVVSPLSAKRFFEGQQPKLDLPEEEK